MVTLRHHQDNTDPLQNAYLLLNLLKSLFRFNDTLLERVIWQSYTKLKVWYKVIIATYFGWQVYRQEYSTILDNSLLEWVALNRGGSFVFNRKPSTTSISFAYIVVLQYFLKVAWRPMDIPFIATLSVSRKLIPFRRKPKSSSIFKSRIIFMCYPIIN